MKKILILLFVLLCNVVSAQQRVTDSLLKKLIKAKDDTDKVNILNGISHQFASDQPLESIRYGNRALELSRKLGWKKGLALAYNNLGNAYCNQGDFENATDKLQTALKIGNEINDKKIVATANSNFAVVYYYIGNYEESLVYNYKALNTRQQIGDKIGILHSYCNIAAIRICQGNNREAVKTYAIVVGLASQLYDSTILEAAYQNIGVAYQNQGLFPQALDYFLLALKVDELRRDTLNIGFSFQKIGLIYSNLGDYPKSLNYYFAALEIFERKGAKRLIAGLQTNIGSSYFEQRKDTEALKHHYEARRISAEIQDSVNIAASYNNIGSVLNDLRNFPEAMYNFNVSLSIYQRLGDTTAMALLYVNIALICFQEQKYKESERYALLGLEFAQKTNSNAALLSSNQLLGTIYEHAHEDALALKHYKSYIEFRDQVKNEDSTKKIVQLQMQYEFDKKEAENEKKAAVAAEASKARTNTLGMMGGSVFLISFISFYFYRKREADKLNRQIVDVRREALNAQMSDHFIGNTMNSINRFIENNEKEKASEYLVLFRHLIRSVMEHSAEKLVPLGKDLEIAANYLELERQRYGDGLLECVTNIPGGLPVDEILVPPMIFQVLVENAVNHGFDKLTGGRILISVRKEGRYLVCTVEDNGCGRKASNQKKLGAAEIGASHGGGLAEKLVKTGTRRQDKTLFEIVDLYDTENNPAGTKVVFRLPYILAE